MNYYKIIASNSYGDSSYSSAASVDTSVIPATPTNLVGTNMGEGQAKIEWSASQYATGYKLYICSSASGTYVWTGINVSTTWTTDIPTTAGVWYYKVSAYNSNGESALSSYVSVDTSQTTPYTLLNYLQSTGTQYINTSVSPASRNSYSLLIDCEFTQLTSGDQHAFGNDTCDLKINLSGNMTLNNVSTYLGTSRHSIQIDVEWNGSTYVKRYHVDSVQKTSYTSSWFANEAICVFGVLSYHNKKAYIKVYSCSIQQNGVTTHEYYPAMRNSDGILGLYDNVTDTFKENSGTGTFLYG